MPPPRETAAPDPTRDALREVRRGLLHLHKTLVDAEREAHEREHGALTSAGFLQVLLGDASFEWLRPFSKLIVEIDEALASREGLPAARARELIGRVRDLVEPPDDSDPGRRYAAARQRNPDVLIAHVELAGRLEDAKGV